MFQVKVPYGNGYVTGELRHGFENVSVSEEPLSYTSNEEIVRALENPVGADFELFRGAKDVAIVTSDLTRPVPNKEILPPLFTQLEKVGVTKDQITILIGTGLHKVATEEEMVEIVGQEIFNQVKVISHDAWDDANLVNLGETSHGTPIIINKNYMEADKRIVLGVLDPHQFAGFAGGSKGVSIGLGGDKLVQHNHSMMINPKASLGNMEGNPIREDIDEIGAKVGIDFIVNVVLNSKKEVVKAVAGHYQEAHKVGVKGAQDVLQVRIAEAADLVIAGSGGFPKDINLYQAQKALLHAAIAVKQGGTVILASECREGVGEDKFTNTMKKSKTPQETLDNFAKAEFMVGAHKAYLWGHSLLKARVILVADGIDGEIAGIMMVEKAATLQEAIDMAYEKLPENPKIYVMPKASSTIPLLEEV